jgi:hypothetical protein
MRSVTLLPLVGLAFVCAACADTTTSPRSSPSDAPRFARAHFVGDRSCTQEGSSLLCDFKVAGLGNISTAEVTVEAPFQCAKTNRGEQEVRPGGLASASESDVPVSNGQITLADFEVSGGRQCPGPFRPDFGGSATLIINGVVIGQIPISEG